jgi:hypothetical protein
VKSISTPPLIYSLQRAEDTELSSDELNCLAKMLAEMIYRNMKMKEKQRQRTMSGEGEGKHKC